MQRFFHYCSKKYTIQTSIKAFPSGKYFFAWENGFPSSSRAGVTLTQKRSLSDNQSKPDHSSDKSNQSKPLKQDQSDSNHSDPNLQTSKTSNKASTYYGATVQRIGSTLHLAEQKYEDFEKQIMSSIRESNQRRFRIYFFGSIATIIVISVVFARPIKEAVSKQTADIAKETLENESLKIQTQELAMAVVQTVLNDKEITAHAAAFLKEASTTPETQKALLELTLHVLRHPQTLDELTILGKRLIGNLTSDKQVIQELGDAFIEVMNDSHLQEVAVKVMAKLFQEPLILQAAMDLLTTVIQKDEVKEATIALVQQTSTEILEDKEVLTQSRQFVADVMGDDLLQKEGGDALMNTIYHALKPGIRRMVGMGLIGISFVALRLFISPF